MYGTTGPGDNVVNVIKHFLSLAPSKRPKDNSSYDCLVSNKDDILMKIRMQIFKELAFHMNKFLIRFQTDAPMVPFLAKCLSVLIRKLMSYIITSSVLDKATTPLSLVKINVSVAGGNCMQVHNIKLPTAVK